MDRCDSCMNTCDSCMDTCGSCMNTCGSCMDFDDTCDSCMNFNDSCNSCMDSSTTCGRTVERTCGSTCNDCWYPYPKADSGMSRKDKDHMNSSCSSCNMWRFK
ncbi:MAG: hypothetical protein PUC65_15995 [Clostridiales bacterium]|nr:hypothetical protein [Clostridiales bacterium]